MFNPQASSSSPPSGQRLTPLALIDLCKAQQQNFRRPKSASPPNVNKNTSKSTSSSKGFNWQRVVVTPPMVKTNVDSFTTPKSTRQYPANNSSRRDGKGLRRQRYDSVPETATTMTLGQIFAAHNAQSTASPNNNKNKFQTPPRSGYPTAQLRRQQSASATLVGSSGRVSLQCQQKPVKESHSAYNLGRSATAFTSRNKGVDQSYIFAASKYCESPLTKSLPLPPSLWLEDTDDEAEEVKKINDGLKMTSIASFPGHLSSAKKSLKKVAEETTSDDGGIVFDLYEEDESSSASDSVSIPSSEGIVANSESPISDIEFNRIEHIGFGKKVSGIRIHPLQLIASVASA